MTTKIELLPTDLQKFNITDAIIADYKNRFIHLKINGLEDKEGQKVVHDAKMILVKKRNEVERVRKELKADALEYGRQVDGEAKRIFALLEPIESHLEAEEQSVENERARIEAEKEKIKKEKIQLRIKKLIDLGLNYNGVSYFLNTFIISLSEIDTNSDSEFELFLGNLKEYKNELEIKKAEQQKLELEEKRRLEKIALEQKAEQNRLDKIAKEQLEQQLKIKAEQEKIDAEKKRIEDLKLKEIADKKHKEEIKEAEKKAAEEAVLKAEIKRKRDEEKRNADLLAEQKQKERAEALKPDKEKLIAYADLVDKYLKETAPSLKLKEARLIIDEFALDTRQSINLLKNKATLLN